MGFQTKQLYLIEKEQGCRNWFLPPAWTKLCVDNKI